MDQQGDAARGAAGDIDAVREYWDAHVHDWKIARAEPGTLEFFRETEAYRFGNAIVETGRARSTPGRSTNLIDYVAASYRLIPVARWPRHRDSGIRAGAAGSEGLIKFLDCPTLCHRMPLVRLRDGDFAGA